MTADRITVDALNDLDDRRIRNIKPLIPPQILMEDYPLSAEAATTVERGIFFAHVVGRSEAELIISGKDDRLMVVVGPCSIHDVKSAIEYAHKLKEYADEARDDLMIVMRVYFEKPRTTVGWKGLINDPHLNGTFRINQGLKTARKLLVDINEIGLPTGCEFLDTISPQYIGDLVSWGAIGARTTESQVHRELASGLSVPVGFKNATDGNIVVSVDAIRAARIGHHFLSVTKQGLSAIVETAGNSSCHIILRGGMSGPNYDAESIASAAGLLRKADLTQSLMVDCSHGNSQKNHLNQIKVANDLAAQLKNSSSDSTASFINGVMIESNLVAGRQNLMDNPQDLVYGQSITDSCLSWDDTVSLLNTLRDAVQVRRKHSKMK